MTRSPWRCSAPVLAPLILVVLACSGPRAELERRGIAIAAGQLVEYAGAGDLEVVDLLLQAEVPVDGRNTYGSTALMAAAETGRVEIARLLIDRGAAVDLGAADSWETPLMLATVRGQEEMVGLLLDAGAAAGLRDRNSGVTPLIMAAAEGHRAIVARLLAGGADVDIGDATGWTALHHAVRKGHDDVVADLLAAGANPEHADAEGYTPLYLAKSRGKWGLVAELESRIEADKREAREAGVQNTPFALPAGWKIVDPFDSTSGFWPQHATFSTSTDPPGSRRVLLRSSADEEAQIFLIVGRAGSWWARFRDRVQEIEHDPSLDEKVILRVHGQQGITLDLRRYRLVDEARAERVSERFLAVGELGEGRIFVLDAGGSPFADGIERIEGVIRDSRLLEALGDERSS